jgi:UDPglucose 6-dehydrogenase
MRIAIIGTGYVGLVTGACLAEFGLYVTCVDIDERKIKNLHCGVIPIYEPGLEVIVKKNVSAGRLTFTSNVCDAIRNNLVVFVAVGTPEKKDGSADLSAVYEVAKKFAENINGYKIIVNKSTVPVGTGKEVKAIINNNMKKPFQFDVVSNPEFLREGSAVNDFMHPDRIVIGAESEQAIAIMKDIYSVHYLNESPFVVTNIETAEIIKYASNAFLALKISYINEIANLCDIVGADVHKVAKAMGMDGRIGQKFLHPGPGFGGSCFPKDTKAFSNIAKKYGYNLKLVDTLIEVNNVQKLKMVDKILKLLNTNILKDLTIAILGLSFKPNTDDIRESPAITIIDRLLSLEAKIKVYDPAAMENVKKIFENKILYMPDEYSAIEDADCLVIVTEWNQFRKLDFDRVRSLLRQFNLADLRNIYEPQEMKELGFNYTCVGRENII